AEEKERLVERHRWFGKLAVSHGLSADDPVRRAATGPATMTMMVASLGFFGIMALVLTGVVLLILGIVFYVTGKLRMAYQPLGDQRAAHLNVAPVVDWQGIQLFQ